MFKVHEETPPNSTDTILRLPIAKQWALEFQRSQYSGWSSERVTSLRTGHNQLEDGNRAGERT